MDIQDATRAYDSVWSLVISVICVFGVQYPDKGVPQYWKLEAAVCPAQSFCAANVAAKKVKVKILL